MRFTKLLSTCGAAALLLSGLNVAQAATVPVSFSHHGIIWEGDDLVNGKRYVEVAIYEGDDSTTPLAENHGFLDVVDGYYDITINGLTTDKILAANGNLKLEIKVDNETLEPRLPINAMPYALVADHALGADAASDVDCEGCIGETQLGTEIVTSLNLANTAMQSIENGSITRTQLNSSVTTSLTKADTALQKIASEYITSDMIKNKTIATADLADSAVTSAKIADGTITSTDISSSAGITKAQLASAVQTSLGLANTAVQKTGTLLPRAYVMFSPSRSGSVWKYDINMSYNIEKLEHTGEGEWTGTFSSELTNTNYYGLAVSEFNRAANGTVGTLVNCGVIFDKVSTSQFKLTTYVVDDSQVIEQTDCMLSNQGPGGTGVPINVLIYGI